MADPTLPQTSTQGGPNPNSGPQGWSMSLADLPGMAQANAPAATGQARAALLATAMQRQAQALGTNVTLPSYDPAAPAVPAAVGGPQPVAVPSRGQSFMDMLAAGAANGGEGGAPIGVTAPNMATPGGPGTMAQPPQPNSPNEAAAQQLDPGIMGALHNWWSNAPGSPAAEAYKAKAAAASTLRSDAAVQYMGQHPSLAEQMQSDPLGTALKLGPVIAARQNGTNGTPGVHVLNTPDGPVAKNDSNSEHTQAVANLTGMTPVQAHAATQWHEYSPAEWLHATAGITNNQLKQMWEMQHYLNPQQQALALSLSQASKDAQGTPEGSAARAELSRQEQIGGGLAMPPMTLPTMPPVK